MIYIDDSEPEGVLEPAFPYRDVTINRGVDANEYFDILSEVGRGKFGTVYKCQEKSTGLKLAAKFVPIPKREDKRNVEREVEIMNSLQHHLIIQLYAAYEYQKMMCVVLELIGGGELFDRVVDDEFVLTERVCVVFIRQVCEAMEFIHRNNILHLDLKPENILCLTQEGNRIKIIDFGLARKFDPDKRLQILFGTPEFVAPEVVNFDCISYGTDMWSVGVICYVLISGLSPFMGETDIETMANVTIAKYDFEDESFSNVSSECLDFIAKLLVKDLSTRMTASQCLEHKWLQQRPKAPPISTPKPINVPPPKLKTDSPTESPIILPDNNDNLEEVKELDTTKDNLKNFIERWEEHPNSPYVFDVEGNVIAPLSESAYTKAHGPDSISSSRVCSPSPCESIETLTDDDEYACGGGTTDDSPSTLNTPINEAHEKQFPNNTGLSTPTNLTPTPAFTVSSPITPTEQLFNNKLEEYNGTINGSNTNPSPNLQQRSIKSYLHTFDRRNSDTNYLLGRRASGERVNLADEIRKLSDHLLMLAQINNKLGNETRADGVNSKVSSDTGTYSKTKTNYSTTIGDSKGANSSSSNGYSSSSIGRTKNTDSTSYTTVNTTKTDTTTTKTAINTSFSSTSSKSGKGKSISSLSMRLQQSIEETPKLTNGIGAPWRSMKKSTVNTITTANTLSTGSKSSIGGMDTTTASVKRAKFRINQKSRDVPIGLPDTHQTVNLEEAANTTKDCLLHLLEKYNDETKCRNPMGRHQSISVDWNVSDNLEYRSMSSINAFFQRHNNTGEHVRQLQAQLEGKATGK